MPALVQRVAELTSSFFEGVALVVIVAGFVIALASGFLVQRAGRGGAYETVRSTFARSVLLGLEILVAADLIRTVTVRPTLSGLAVLAGLVGIRTFLSWSFQVEIDGRWPWQRAEATGGAGRERA